MVGCSLNLADYVGCGLLKTACPREFGKSFLLALVAIPVRVALREILGGDLLVDTLPA